MNLNEYINWGVERQRFRFMLIWFRNADQANQDQVTGVSFIDIHWSGEVLKAMYNYRPSPSEYPRWVDYPGKPEKNYYGGLLEPDVFPLLN